MNFREKLIQLRDGRNLSQQELADLLGVSRQTVVRWEAGKSVPSVKQIPDICSAFGVDADTLLGISDSGSEKPLSDVDRENEKRKAKQVKLTTLIVFGVLIAAAVAGLIVTICYAVKDGAYDTSSTVWIVSIPQNTPMIVLSVVLTVFIVLLVVFFIRIIRKWK